MDLLLWGGFFSWCVNLVIAIFVILKDRKNKVNLTFGIAGISIGGWSVGSFLVNFIDSPNAGLFSLRICHVFAFFVPSLLYHFGTLLTETTEKRKKSIKLFYFCSALFIPFVLSPLFIRDIEIYGNYLTAIPGPIHHLYMIFFSIVMTLFFANLFIGIKNAKVAILKKQLLIYTIGMIFALLAGLVYFSGVLRIIPDIYIADDYLLVISFFIVAYTIVKYKFMEIDTVVHKTLLWMITVVILVVPPALVHGYLKLWFASLPFPLVVSIDILVLIIFFLYFQQLKPRIDHLFRRRKYDYYMVLAELGEKVGSELNIKKVAERILTELQEVLYIRNGILLTEEPLTKEYRKIHSIGYHDINEKSIIENDFTILQSFLQEHKQALLKEPVLIDPQFAKVKGAFLCWTSGLDVELIIPILLEGRLTGIICLGKKENLQSYTLRDIELLEKMGKQLGTVIDNALHHQDIVEKERLSEEMKLGREIQMSLLPETSPNVEGLKIDGIMIPAKEIGGDYYDYIVSSSEIVDSSKNHQASKLLTTNSQLQTRVSIVIGDVSGKGVGAGLIMATAKATLKGMSEQGFSPKETLVRTNNLLHEYTKGQKFMTMLYMEWDSQEKKLRYSSAGHEHIIIYRSNGILAENSDIQSSASGIQQSFVEAIPSGGFILGMLPEIGQYLEDKELRLLKGDKIVLYTDGVTEAHNVSEELFTLTRLTESVKKHGHKSSGELLTCLKEEVYGFIGAAEQFDDITLLVIECTAL